MCALRASLRPASSSLVTILGSGVIGVLLVIVATRMGFGMALLAICGLIGAVAVFLFPALGFLLTAAAIPLERIGRLTNDSSMYTVSLMRIIGLLALGSFLLHALIKKWKLRFGIAFFVYFAYCSLGALTILYTTDELGAVRATGAILGNLVFFFVVVNMVRNWSFAKLGMIVWLGASVLVGAYTIYDWHFGHSMREAEIGETGARLDTVFEDYSEWESLERVKRATGTTSHAAVYGINMILTLPFFAFLFRTKLTWRMTMLVLLGLVIVIYNILLTNTRAAILLAAAVSLLCCIRKMFVVTAPRVVSGLLLGSVLLLFVPEAVWQRVLDTSNYSYQRSGTLRIRLNYWSAGLRIAEDNWLFGIGLGNKNTIPKYLNQYGPESTSVHNDYLQTFIEVGEFGWLAFFGFVGLILWYAFKAGSIFRRFPDRQELYWFMTACQIAMISVMIYGLQVDVFHFPLKGWWLIAGLSWAMYQIAKKLLADGSKAEVKLNELRLQN